MSIITFEGLFNKYGIVGDVAKERDKFADVVDAVGIDPSLLKGGNNGEDTNQTSKLPWRLPEESGAFIKWVLENYTTKDFKALRKANFHETSLETVEHLIKGFCFMLQNLGYSSDAVEPQRRAMAHRMRYIVRSSRSKVDATIKELTDTFNKFEQSHFDMRKDELAFFFGFANEQLKDVLDYICEVYNDYVDIRHDELTDLAWDEAASSDEAEAMERINQDLMLYDALGKDKHFQRLSAEREKLLNSNDFIKKFEKRFAEITEEMDTIRRQHEVELFGYALPEEDKKLPPLRSPADVLQDAVLSVKESREMRRHMEEEQAKITPEQREQMRKCYERICEEQGWEPYPHTVSPDEPPKEEAES